VLIPDGAGTAKFAVDAGIAALETRLTQVDPVLGTHVAGFSIRMVDTFSHVRSSPFLPVLTPIRFSVNPDIDNLAKSQKTGFCDGVLQTD
jgi:hypothetical protein